VRKTTTFVLSILFSLVAFAASAADCSDKIKADQPLWGTIGTIIEVSVAPVTDKEELQIFGPSFKYQYTVQYANGIRFKSYVVYPDTKTPLKVGYQFAWVPVTIATEGRVSDSNRYTPTAYSHSCKPHNLDLAWTKDQIVNGL